MATIREMSKVDIDVIYLMECELFEESAWPKETLLQDLETFYFDVLEDQGQIVGYCSYMVMYEHGDVLNIGVSQRFQRHGYGSILMDHMLTRMKDLGASVFTLEVRVSNVPAIGLYEKCGFKKAAIRRQYYQDGEDAFLMVLE